MEKMYYDRTLSCSFSKLIEPNGELRWLFDFVKDKDDLDFLIGKNKSKEWISVYRGLTSLIKISKRKSADTVNIDGAKSYKEIAPDLYKNGVPVNKNFHNVLVDLYENIRNNEKFDRYYNNQKEGYYQNELSRKHGINGNTDSNFVIVDKEAVIGYEDQDKKTYYSEIYKNHIKNFKNIYLV